MSTVASTLSRNALLRCGGADSATTDVKYVSARSLVSLAPPSRITGLAGSQSAPPDRAVDPPTVDDFSTIRTDSPRSCAARAAAMPVPEPTTRRSTVVSLTGSPAGMVVWRITAVRLGPQHPRG